MNRRNITSRITLFGQSQSDSFKYLVDPVSLINSVLGSDFSDDSLELECTIKDLKASPVICINLNAPTSEAHLSEDGSELTIDPYKLTVCEDSSAALKALMILCNDRVNTLPDEDADEELDEDIKIAALSELSLQFRDMDVQVTIHFISK